MGRKRTTSDTWRPIHIDSLPAQKYIRDTYKKPTSGDIKPTSGRYVIDLTDKLPNGNRMPGRCRRADTMAQAKVVRTQIIARYNKIALEILGRADEPLAAVAVSPGKGKTAGVAVGEVPTFAEAVTNPNMGDAWMSDLGKSKMQRATILRELRGHPMAILGGYPINQIAHAEWDLFRTTLLNTRTRYGIRKQMAVEDALKYKVEMRRLKRQSKSEDGGNRYSSRPRNGAEIAHEDVELPFVSADRVKRLKAYCQNLFDAAANKGYGPNRWADIKYVPNKDEDRERTGRRFFEEDEENPSDLRLTSDEARGFIANGVTVPQRMAILQEVFSCRGGEGMGSTWGQLRELNGRYILAITHQVREENNKPIRTARLKTTRSKREVLASKSDADLIALLGPRGRDSDFIITNSEKLPVPRVVQEEYFVALMNAGLTHRPDRRDATPHAFRSHCISKWLNQEKREAIQVMQWAGHSKLDTTVKYYLESNWKEMARKMIDNDSS